ncbi:MAG: hypothetical protein L0Z50_19215 [Verrucomicrobiales bacterium]|nr:hypothetical protein [Verrucomicrobiales bacterium]
MKTYEGSREGNAPELLGNGRIYACDLYFPRQHKEHWNSAWSQAILKVKHRNVCALDSCTNVIGQLLKESITITTPHVITFVPPEPAAAHQQCSVELLAYSLFRTLSDNSEVSFERLLQSLKPRAIKQHRCTTRWERTENVRGCYAVTQPHLVLGKTVIVIDDIITSGATMRECQKVLLEAGAMDVIGFVLAKTVGW